MMGMPSLAPRDSYALWYTPASTFALTAPGPSHRSSNESGHALNPHLAAQARQQQLLQQNRRPTALSPLAQLIADEQQVEQRKISIQRFGATWIKPLGCTKTLQGDLDDQAEREEAERAEQQEMLEGGEDSLFPEDLDATGHERDLDEDIPEPDLDGEVREAEQESFADGVDLDAEIDDEVDLDADILEAEAETLWDDSDEEEEDEAGDDTEGGETGSPARLPSMTSTQEGNESQEESPQQAIFSHDEAFGPERTRGLHWRASRYRDEMDEDRMDVDSE